MCVKKEKKLVTIFPVLEVWNREESLIVRRGNSKASN